MKTFYGSGRVNGNIGTFFVEADNMEQARSNFWNSTSRREGVQLPNLLKTATPAIEEQLMDAAEKGEGQKPGIGKYTAYNLGDGVTFLEFWEPREEEKEEE
jgi:hypothetical protein